MALAGVFKERPTVEVPVGVDFEGAQNGIVGIKSDASSK
jgi:hypothetical protein